MGRTCPDCKTEWTDDVDACPDDGAQLIDPLIGKSLGSYKVLKQIGKGGMGSVYLAEHPVIRSRVAIKVLHEKYAQDAAITDRFYNEARAVNVIGHDNVLKILDLNTTASGQPYFVMEFLDGRSLQAMVDPQQPVALSDVGPILLQICAALQAAHDNNIVHRDLKPENIYLVTVRDRRNYVKVVDFGIAKLTDSQGQSAGQTRTGMVMGTPMYMSPEQGSGATKSIGPRSDIYSLGVIMFQLATGRLPFAGKSFGELLAAHLQKAPPSPRSLNRAVPPDFERIILKALEKKQEDRFQSMHAVSGALREMLRANKIAFEQPSSVPSLRSPAPARAISMSDTLPDGALGQEQYAHDDGPPVPTMLSEGADQLETVSPTMAFDRPERSAHNATTGPPRIPTSPPRIPTTPAVINARARAAGREPSVPPIAPPSSRRWIWIGGGAALCIAVALFFAFPSSDDSPAPARGSKSGAARRGPNPATPPPPTKPAAPAAVSLNINTHPSPAHVTATWPEGSETGESPLVLHALPGTHLNVSIELEGYSPHIEEVIVEETDQTIDFALHKSGQHRPPRPRSGGTEPRRDNDLVNPFGDPPK